MPSRAERSRESIAEAATVVLVRDQLSGLSLDAVAREAQCAKGLVNYHYRTKVALLAAVARRLADRRRERLLAAMQAPGAEALDTLFGSLAAAARAGEAAGRFALAGLAEPEIRRALLEPLDRWLPLAESLAESLESDPLDPESMRAFLTMTDGVELALLTGDDEDEVKSGFYRAILALTA